MNTPQYNWRTPDDSEGNKALAVREMAADIESTTHTLEVAAGALTTRVAALETASVPGAAIPNADGTLPDLTRAVNAILGVLRAKNIVAS